MPSLQGFPMCCGADILTGFTFDPSASSGWKLTSSGASYERDEKGNLIPVTYRDKFLKDFEQKRKNTPNRMYCCILNQHQYDQFDSSWPKLLKEIGFEFIRSWSNSIHDGTYMSPGTEAMTDHRLYLFVFVTDDKGKNKDFLSPPPGWDELPTGVQSSVAAAA